jgi:O-antigen/teichoic acid export membrane protein
MSPAAAMALNSVVAAIVFMVAHSLLNHRLPAARTPELVRGGRRWIAASIPMALTDGMRVVQSELSVILLGLLTTPTDVGLFRIAIVTSFAAATPVAVINQVAFPVIAKLYAERDVVRLQIAVTRLAQAQLAGVLILCAPLVLAPEPLVNLVFGAQFVPAANTLRILCIAQVVTAALGTNVALLNMSHHERRVTRAMAIALVLNFSGVAVLGSLWGRAGAAIGVGSALICWNIITWVDARRLLGINTAILNFSAQRSA